MKLLITLLLIAAFLISPKPILAANSNPYWDIQSVDTMKLSRDQARKMISDPASQKVIDEQVKNISELGATHVAVGTPYDPEFIGVLKKWIASARNHDLKVWFRGNMSGWEGWFDYSAITKDKHNEGIVSFILDNPDLFEDGDVFTPCPECENGIIGDPRMTGDVIGYRNFLLSEYKSTTDAFSLINKKVNTGYFSMNGDVARLIMDKETTRLLGGNVVIDHYVRTPEQLARDINELAESSGGKIVLGEFGVPIPDIHGFMSENEQGEWLANALALLVGSVDLTGVNYWTASHGSSALWSDNGQKKAVADVLGSYYKPNILSAKLVNSVDIPIKDAVITAGAKSTVTDDNGNFTIVLSPFTDELVISADTYYDLKINIDELDPSNEIILAKAEEGVVYKILKTLYSWGYRFD